MTWIGSRDIAFVLAEVTGGPGIPPPPPDWEAQARRRIFYDPDSGVDRSLRAYIRAVSYGMARLTGEVYGPYTVPWHTNGCGWTMDTAIKAAGRPDPDNALNRATLASQGSITGYSYACIIYPGGPCDGWAFWGLPPGNNYPGSTLTGACYVDMEAGLGTWAMENTHILTAFGDLYGIPDSPGNFDNMACNCGTHPSSFTKIKMGWVNPRDISASPSGTTVTLHALSNALRPGEAGREHAVKIPSQRSSLAYLLVEARLRTDPYERSTPGLSSGIPSEGVVVYWIDEISWPPVHLRTPTALGVGQSYTEEPLGIRIAVDSQENVGFVVTIRAVQDTKRTLKVSMEPNRPRLGMPATYTVRATDAETGVDVQGSKVTITNPSGDPQVFDVNTPFTFTFRTQRILVDPVPPRRFETIYPEGVVNAPGYLETPIDFGFV